MYNIILIIHVLVAILLLGVILMQRGRGGGLVESLAGAESLFGTKTSSFLVRTTTILAILFFVTSTSLAFLSKQKSKSVLDRNVSSFEQEQDVVPSEVTEDVAVPAAQSQPTQNDKTDVKPDSAPKQES